MARKYNVIVLSDEIYGRLHFTGDHVSIARFYPEGTIVSSGLSKWCGAGGWRLGTFTCPRELNWLVDAMAAVASESFTSVSAPIQYAAVRAFQCGVDIERYLWHARRVLAAIATPIVSILKAAGVRVHAPVGGFYLFLDFSPFAVALAHRGIKDGPTLCDRLLEEANVAILPGVSFGRSRHDLTARLAFVDFDGGAALAASENYPLDHPLPDDFFEAHCRKVLDGVRAISKWLTIGADGTNSGG